MNRIRLKKRIACALVEELATFGIAPQISYNGGCDFFVELVELV